MRQTVTVSATGHARFRRLVFGARQPAGAVGIDDQHSQFRRNDYRHRQHQLFSPPTRSVYGSRFSGANVPVTPGTYNVRGEHPEPGQFRSGKLGVQTDPVSDQDECALIRTRATTSQIPKLEFRVASPNTRSSATSPSVYSVSSNSVVLTDATPVNMELVVINIGGAGSGPAAFTPGSAEA